VARRRAQRPGVATALACALLICVLAVTSHAAFVVETGVLTVQRPEGLGPYDMSVANFGRTIYGGTLRCAPAGVMNAPFALTNCAPRSGQLQFVRANAWGCAPFEVRPARGGAHGARSGRSLARRSLTRALPVRCASSARRHADALRQQHRQRAWPARHRAHRPRRRAPPAAGAAAWAQRLTRFPQAGPPGQAACAFTTKSLHAQNAGAAAVLIVDNRLEGLITMGATG
jgi:hypothetical protein